ncbi:DUF6461 domain-containing protein [Streptomyces cyaneofuscatus]|uniref:DUF6461 domain-containing protein n=1 Tax=Streptomyces cyaneofuscatus TaxID=66883 RepID=UPI003829D4E5
MIWLRADGWGYTMAEGGPVRANGPEGLSLLSAGTEAVEVFRTANSDMMFGYARSGTVLCRFEPGREYEREGADPDLLVPAMEHAGPAVSRPDGPEAEAADAARDPETGVLSLLETHFGISPSSREVREGKLLCAVRPA